MPDTGVQVDMKKWDHPALWPQSIRTRERLGGLLKFYSREAA